ncbi:ABC transporter ATP-binding protein [Aneurinibacillus sp. Ricciae_BoGa-3]|uniref:ABC transporter ATP-binding protein n=1 Tax=Aneurinibacillus sp. Ricciae_BoGa-3 TaxID=3022697 RepID=UPI0023425E58|nr:ABC transporter ATP-binding protein [Aneurinibacillus sp. Ricciae_BoGa-3]WCK54900.1 ABC transporter ATP-binding protein [Aneurinibacillus sp. Ricciae_BoGa-3]
MSQVVLKDIKKTFDGKDVIPNINLTIPSGSFTVLVGPSGCGKSTTLRMIAGLEHSTSGEILIDGQKVNQLDAGKRDIAMVFQNYALYPTMTVKENIEFGLKNRKVPKADREAMVQEMADTVGLTDYLSRKPSELSGGQRQRVALARAMVKKPKVFLMDEPLSNLDAQLRQQMRFELMELHQKLKATFIYVTHDQVEAMSLGDQIVIMNKGVIQQAAMPTDVYHKPANEFVAQFIGSPPMNIFSAKQVGVNLNGAAKVGIRPENMHIQDAQDSRPNGHSLYVQGTVAAREMLGSETLFYIDSSIGRFVVKAHGELPFANGAHVKVELPMDSLCGFDEGGSRR